MEQIVKETNGVDLGERYTSDHDYKPGTVVMIGGTHEVTQATNEGQLRLAGVVTVSSSWVLNSTLQDSVIVALIGRVLCNVVGKINKGDLLTISDIPGAATATHNPLPGTIVGRALESYDSNAVGTIEIKVDRG